MIIRAKSGLPIDDIDLVEINEAYATPVAGIATANPMHQPWVTDVNTAG